MSIRTYAVNCNDAWLNTEGDDISGSYVKYKDHQEVVAAIEAKCSVLAAEKERFAVECAATKIAIAYLKSGRQYFTLNTPSTDAFLAEVRAQGVEMLGEAAEQLMDEFSDDSYKVMVTADLQRLANAFAAQLRQESAQ